MYDIEELEAQWRRYHRKRLVRRGVFASLILLIVALPILYVSFKPSKPLERTGTEKKSDSKQNRPIATTPEKNGSKPVVASVQKVGNEQSLSPQAPSMSQEAAPKRKKPKMMISFSGNDSGEESTGKGKVDLDMVKRTDEAVVKQIEKRFPVSKDYDDAMYLAKYYYGKKNYKKSEYWAMQANVVDSTQPESWILFGKSKAKRGHRVEALKVLQQYYDNTGNLEAKMLIDRIRKGRKF